VIQAITALQHQQLAKQHQDQRHTNVLQDTIVNQVSPLPNNAQPVPINTKKDNLHALTVQKAITVLLEFQLRSFVAQDTIVLDSPQL